MIVSGHTPQTLNDGLEGLPRQVYDNPTRGISPDNPRASPSPIPMFLTVTSYEHRVFRIPSHFTTTCDNPHHRHHREYIKIQLQPNPTHQAKPNQTKQNHTKHTCSVLSLLCCDMHPSTSLRPPSCSSLVLSTSLAEMFLKSDRAVRHTTTSSGKFTTALLTRSRPPLSTICRTSEKGLRFSRCSKMGLRVERIPTERHSIRRLSVYPPVYLPADGFGLE